MAGFCDRFRPRSERASGFGVNEYPLPPGANITLVNTLHRHGSRYPTTNASAEKFGKTLTGLIHAHTVNFTGALSFLNTWSYQLGYESWSYHHRESSSHRTGMRYLCQWDDKSKSSVTRRKWMHASNRPIDFLIPGCCITMTMATSTTPAPRSLLVPQRRIEC